MWADPCTHRSTRRTSEVQTVGLAEYRLAHPTHNSTRRKTVASTQSLPREEFDDDVHIDRQAEIVRAGDGEDGGPQRFRVEGHEIRGHRATFTEHTLVQVVDRF